MKSQWVGLVGDVGGTNARFALVDAQGHVRHPRIFTCKQYASLADVKQCLALANYPEDKVRYVVGDVVKTLAGNKPEQIAILRLDTDFYDSTKAELEQLYGLLSPGGILIIDDYGSWDGARKAVDEFNAALPRPLFLARIDETGRIAQKP